MGQALFVVKKSDDLHSGTGKDSVSKLYDKVSKKMQHQ